MDEINFYFLLLFSDVEVWIQLFVKVSNYEKELEEMKNMTRQEFVASLRRYF